MEMNETGSGQVSTLYEKVIAAFRRENKSADGIEPAWFARQPRLFLCGGGHVAGKVAQLGKFLDFQVTVYEERKEYAVKEQLPWADEIICDSYENLSYYLEKSGQRYYVVATSGHDRDLLCVEQILCGDYAYVGMLGSKGKAAHVKRALIEFGLTEEQVSSLHTPIGIKIGGQTPEEIAVSIAAELIQVKNIHAASAMPSELEHLQKEGILCIITCKQGFAPRGVGSMMFVPAGGDSSVIGTIGGGTVEMLALREAGLMLKQGDAEITVRSYGCGIEKPTESVCQGRVEVTFLPLLNAEE